MAWTKLWASLGFWQRVLLGLSVTVTAGLFFALVAAAFILWTTGSFSISNKVGPGTATFTYELDNGEDEDNGDEDEANGDDNGDEGLHGGRPGDPSGGNGGGQTPFDIAAGSVLGLSNVQQAHAASDALRKAVKS
mgnify:CR=1 FL=1|jgi:hypothetical protein